MSESPALLDPEVVEVVKQLEAEGLDSESLDAAVHDAASERASVTNNDCLYAQVRYLLRGGDHSWKPADVLYAARQAKEGASADDVESSQEHWSSPNGCHPDCPACVEEDDPLPKFMLSSDGALKGDIIGTRACKLEGCGGQAYIVRWPGGKRTYPCGKGCKASDLPDTIQIA
jgi:hypothetical protein